MTKEVMKQALEALRMPCEFWNKTQFIKVTEAIKTLEEALKQEQDEPFGYLRQTSCSENPPHGWAFYFSSGEIPIYTKPQPNQEQDNGMCRACEKGQCTAKHGCVALSNPLLKQEQGEPVATLIEHYAFTDGIVRFDGVENMEQLPLGTKLYTTPQQRKPLTRKDIDRLHEEDCFSGNIYEITAEIEAAHGIKE